MPHAPSDALSGRHDRVRRALAERKLDALIVTALPNILYLTNFGGSSAIVLVTMDRLLFLTDFRYVAAVSETRGSVSECPGLELVTADGSYDAALARMLGALPSGRIGFEASHLSVSRHSWLQRALGDGDTAPQLVPVDGVVEHARVRKDPYELALLREGARRLSEVAAALSNDVRAGRTEREIAFDIDLRIRRAGFDKTAFDTIVASGPNAGLPHAGPTERTLTAGDLVVLDFGGVYNSYCVDLTRTAAVGTVSARAREVHAAVSAAHDCAIRAIGPGVSRFAIDEAARASLAACGLAEAFGHGTGHGLGIEVHEDPKIARRRPDTDSGDEAVAAGMVFTIEPGAYFPGWGGVRIEDDVLVTEEGVEVLTQVSTNLIEL